MDPQGYDAGKKVTGRKRHILVDTLGLLLSVAVHPADIQDRDGVAFVLNASTRALFPFLERIFADGGYQGPRAAEAAAATGKWIIDRHRFYDHFFCRRICTSAGERRYCDMLRPVWPRFESFRPGSGIWRGQRG